MNIQREAGVDVGYLFAQVVNLYDSDLAVQFLLGATKRVLKGTGVGHVHFYVVLLNVEGRFKGGLQFVGGFAQ